MCQKLDTLAEDFACYRAEKKRVKYPLILWERAIKTCGVHPPEKVAKKLGVNICSLRRYLNPKMQSNNENPHFATVQITHSQPPIQIHLSGSVQMTIDFNRSVEELAKLMIAIQEGSPC